MSEKSMLLLIITAHKTKATQHCNELVRFQRTSSRFGVRFTSLLFQQSRKSLTKTHVHTLRIVFDVPGL